MLILILLVLQLAFQTNGLAVSNSSIVADIVANETLIVETTTTTTMSPSSTTSTTASTTTTTTTTTPIMPKVENVTVTVPSNNMSHCNMTKFLFSNLVNTVESNQPLAMFHSDLNELSSHLANYTNASNRPVVVMIQKLLDLLNSSITDCKTNYIKADTLPVNDKKPPVVVHFTATHTLNKTNYTTEHVSNSSGSMNNTTHGSTVLTNLTNITNSTAINVTKSEEANNKTSNAVVDEKLESEKWNSMFKLIKFEYYRKEHKDEEDKEEDNDSYGQKSDHDDDDDDDSDRDNDDETEVSADDPENGHYYFYGKYYSKNDD